MNDYHHLLSLGKVIVGILVQLHATDKCNWNEFFWNNFRGIQEIKSE